ncbi:protein Largen [Triplophysa rosa]|uniref:Proline-rich protein 16-like n=1 Tax=Triplophysa rosa TaxID=992332 RepID=A0A9W7WEG5_TRIRA|nr:protein Largen [Triplophysa rosa]KAI7798272.1 putative proline-rich protein 16-like [Triplophysa rosa]
MSGADGAVNKVKVKRRIRSIVKDLENILGDLKDVAKELKEVVQDIDCLTSDLHLEEEMIDSSRTDTLNSTSTSSSMDRMKVYPEEMLFRPSSVSSAILTVLKRPNRPLPPPRAAPSRAQDHGDGLSSEIQTAGNGMPTWNAAFPANALGRDSCRGLKSTVPLPSPLSRHVKSRCPQTTRERVRFSEKVQYHGYCPDCDLQYDVPDTDLHFHTEVIDVKVSPSHQCSSSLPSQSLMENGNIVSFPPQKPHKTILRKSTSTTV